MRETGVNRDHRKRSDQHHRHAPGAEADKHQQKRGGGQPDAQFAVQIVKIGVDADLGADAVIDVVEEVAPNRRERITEGRPIKDRADRRRNQPAADQRREAPTPAIPGRPEEQHGHRRREVDPQQADHPQQDRRNKYAAPGADPIARLEQVKRDHQQMGGDNLVQRPGLEIDEFRGNRDDKGRDEPGAEPEFPPAPQKAAHDGRASHDAEADGHGAKVIMRAVPDDAGNLHQSGDHPRQQPGPHAELKFPWHQTVAEDEAMGRFDGLKDLVAPVDARHKNGRNEAQHDAEDDQAQQARCRQ